MFDNFRHGFSSNENQVLKLLTAKANRSFVKLAQMRSHIFFFDVGDSLLSK